MPRDINEILDNYENLNTVQCVSLHEVESLLVNPNSLNIICQNIRSVKKNVDAFQALLNCCNFEVHMIILTETWNVDHLTFILPGYKSFSSTAHINKAEGVVIYIRNDLNIKSIEVDVMEHCNSVFVGIIIENDIRLGITSVYRSPDRDVICFLETLRNHLKWASTYKFHVFVGDININIKKLSDTSQEYLDIFANFGFSSFINEFTRVSCETQSCIDHIFVKN